ncbi:chromosomal replication initiator protein DnaA [Patescibacteria group bacterium]|nr:chromosomal replication initiator protein DnaA [Patescibacteria group bacterium]MBU2158596.1 chromosomal replication initiator protein DnaA [Patescibacteria group bacterium]MBU2220601.1 chromosomal replication initiator protein DnaA [Patescibacteria group bacterium]
MNRLDARELWEYVLTQVELSISPANFNTWFRDSSIVKIEDGIVYIGVPSQFFRDWYLKKFNMLLLKIVRSVSHEYRNIEYTIVKDDRRRVPKEPRRAPQQTTEMPLDEFYINKSDNLNPRYTFDNFVIGAFNELAHTAAQTAIKRPGITYNPLFIYGETGRGKTHLIQAIGNQFKRLYPTRKIYYLTSEKFGTDYTDSLQAGTANRFKEKYRQFDLIIMDDVQFLSKKEKMQEELFHLFNAFHDNNKQVIFSSDRAPAAIPDIADRLRGRFASGMTVDIGEPDSESRMAIVRKKAAIHGVTLSDEVVEHIATSVAGSIRELEGVINSVVCHTQVKGVPPDLAEVRQSLRSFARPQKTVSVKHVVSKVAEFYGIDEESIYEKTRRREVVRPRQVIMYILREDFSVSYPTIGSKLGGRDHTTVIHSCEKVKREVVDDTELAKEIQDIRTLLV